MERARWKLHLSVVGLAIAAMALALTPAVADPLAGTDEYPDVAFLARNDVPFDAQTAASMAAQLGAPMFITNPNVLSDAARDGIADLNPEVLIVAGGIFAISDDVANAAAAACDPDCTVDRYAGAGRDETAAALAGIADKYGFDRPALQGTKQVVGDVHVGGTVHTDTLTVQDTDPVSGLNADRVDGKHADEFVGSTGAHAVTVLVVQSVGGGAEVFHTGYSAGLRATGTGPGNAYLSAPVPSTLFGHETTSLTSAEYCYDATDPGTTLTTAWLLVGEANPADPGGTAPAFVNVETERSDAACRNLTLDGGPYPLDGDETATVVFNVDFDADGDEFHIGRVTFHFAVN